MGWIRRGAVALVALALLAGAAAAVYVLRSFSALDGRLQAAGLTQPVKVRRDEADVTHIEAATPFDAWFAMGYVHAQERTWQLEFNRRLMHGELSELFGPAALDTDRLMRTLDIAGAARRQYAGLPPFAREALQAYSRGIASFHQHRPQALPPEFLLLGAQPGGASGTPWSPEDSVGWALMMALDLSGNWGSEFARLSLARTLPTDRLWQLMPPYPGEAPATSVDLAALYERLGVYRAQGDKVSAAEATAVPSVPWAHELFAQAGDPGGRGSNNWVVAGSRTVSGKPLLANDPHLGLGAPALWYFARLKAPAGVASDGSAVAAMDVIGATLPGLPFVVLGRTAQAAWGFTNTAPDVQDLYLEQIDPADAKRYRTPDGWAPFTQREHTIRVKGQPDVRHTVRATRHGPVLSDAQPALHGGVIELNRHVLALRWSALDADNQTVLAGLLANQAQSVDELFAAFAHYHSPMQSVVAADVHGHIAFKAMGRVPLRGEGNDMRGVAPAPGWDARYDWQGWLPLEGAPQDDGAARGWLATANQRITAQGYAHFITADWALPYRYDRIAERLEVTPRHDVASLRALQQDTVSLAALRLLPHLAAAPSTHALAGRAQAELQGWDGDMRTDRAAPLIFALWTDELARGLLLPRMGADRFAALYGRRDFRAAIEGILERGDAWWCQPLTCPQQAGAALHRALDRLAAQYGADPARWRWGAAHPALSVHRPFSNVPLLARWFDVRVPSPGDAYTVNVGQYNPAEKTEPFASRHAASLRAVYDLGDPEQSLFIYQTGQSGLVFSPRYRDMAEAWAQGGLRRLQLAPERFRHRLVLEP
ncbi:MULTISPECIES: penicillin acylase family protein [unclassified Acidovorax]|uniref:penicillin acylase family protein n=1 Tax=unclassified Acidovorax TaxID=2684926 RepID=UPI0028833B93|nr:MULTISPECIES: penicillin acylase family protein [unclassified Acidovorax]